MKSRALQNLFRQKSHAVARRGREPFRLFNRQKRYRLFWLLRAAFCVMPLRGALAAETGPQITLAQESADFLAQGNTTDAARKAQAALQIAPDDGLIEILAGAVYLQTGNAVRAQTLFDNALKQNPNDALAHYGAGLSDLAQGKRQAARRDFARAMEERGELSALVIAQNYERSFNAKTAPGEDAKLARDSTAAERALRGMALARSGAKLRAIALLETALAEMPLDFSAPPAGLRMAFTAQNPFVFLAPLSAGLAPDAATAQTVAIDGDVQFAPQNAAPETAYVSYEIDGQSVGLVNVAPFHFTLDSRRVANGLRILAIHCYDGDGRELSATERKLRVYNRPVPNSAEAQTGPTESESAKTLRSALWKVLTPAPDRAVLAAQLGELLREQGDRANSEFWLWQAAGQNAANPEARKRLAAVGVRTATESAFYSGLTTRREIALTFDDGPKPGLTEPLIDLLIREKVLATFFVIGRNAAANPDIMRRIARAGMELANHSYTHRNLTRLTAAEIAAEMAQTQAVIYTLTGQRPRYMRPPGGAWNAKANNIARQWGLTPCFWTADVFGSEVVSAAQTAQSVISQARPGAIILMHNGKLSTLQALPTILRDLRAKGYTFVTAATLAKHFNAARTAERNAVKATLRKRRAE